jgi:hypothetical protein
MCVYVGRDIARVERTGRIEIREETRYNPRIRCIEVASLIPEAVASTRLGIVSMNSTVWVHKDVVYVISEEVECERQFNSLKWGVVFMNHGTQLLHLTKTGDWGDDPTRK